MNGCLPGLTIQSAPFMELPDIDDNIIDNWDP